MGFEDNEIPDYLRRINRNLESLLIKVDTLIDKLDSVNVTITHVPNPFKYDGLAEQSLITQPENIIDFKKGKDTHDAE